VLFEESVFFMIKVLLVPSSDYVGHPFPQRHNQLFDRMNNEKNFEVHAIRFRLFDRPKLETKLILHELDEKRMGQVALHYLINGITYASQIRRIVREENIDVIVLSNLAAPFAYTIAERISSLDVPIIFDLPDYYPTSAAGYVFDVKSAPGKSLTRAFDLILRYMIKRASAVTAASQTLVEYSARAGARSVVLVPNGIAECFFKLREGNNLREKLGYSEEDLVVGYVGSLEFWLDMRSLIDGVALARKKGLPVKLLVIGSRLFTDYSEKVMQWVRHAQVEKHTDFLGFVPHEEVPERIAEFDVGVMPFDVLNPTAYYAAPNKMWEYLSQKKPVISTPIPEVLRNSDCVLTALTPADYAQKLFSIAKSRAHGKTIVSQKVETGYRKALNRTWKNSAALFASTIYSSLDQTC